MSVFEYPELVLTQIALLVISGIWLLRRNDEIPLLISTLLFYVSSFRYGVVTSGLGRWINTSSRIGLGAITKEDALTALSYIILGQICFLATYMWRQRQILPVTVPFGEPFFFRWLRPTVILFGLFCLPLILLTRSSVITQLRSGRSLAFEISGYLYLFPLVLIGVAVLLVCLWKFGGLPSAISKIGAVLILIGVVYFTFGPSRRFQFLGWLIASAVILSCSYRPKTRLIILSGLAVLCLGLFALAGVMRNPQLTDVLNQATLERAYSAEDANMLDGFVMVQHVYPHHLDFRWGMEHLEILLRPIPRAWWPEKPVGGGYASQFGLVNSSKGTTLGISPSLFGSFYAEGGIIGILCFSVLYGAIVAAIVRCSTRIQPFAGVMIRAILSASLVPLLRGGDLAGIYAWIGMAFWPCFLLLWIKRAYFKQKFYLPTIVEMSTDMPLSKLPYE